MPFISANTAHQRKTEHVSMPNECVITRSAMHIQTKHRGAVSKTRQACAHPHATWAFFDDNYGNQQPKPISYVADNSTKSSNASPQLHFASLQHCHATTRPSMQAHASLSQQSVFSTYSTAEHSLQAEPQAPAKQTILASSDHVPALCSRHRKHRQKNFPSASSCLAPA